MRPLLTAVAALVAVSSPALSQRPNPDVLVAAQKEAMKPFAALDGVWRGTAWTLLENGKKQNAIQTERIGPFLDGAIKVVEGRGYDAETGQPMFNAFGIISYDAMRKTYMMQSHAQGSAGSFRLDVKDDGYVWEIPAGPMTIRYTVTIKDGTWNEVGDRIIAGQPPIRFLEMNLRRIGDTDWPAAGAIPSN